MRFSSILLAIFSFIFLPACSASYKELSEGTYNPPSEFTKYLLDSYKTMADFEAKEMHDWNSAKLYSEKALAASSGKTLKPEEINYWKIPTTKITEFQQAYDNLMVVYDDAITNNPYNLAIAVSSLDCWSEQQEENWQNWDILRCKEDFLNAMHQIYDSLKTNNQKKISIKKTDTDSASIITKNKNEKILQIIYFDFDKSELSQVSINSIKSYIEKNSEIINKFIIVGHTDTKGTKKYNMNLSLQRALAVKDILINIGINNENIKILAKGESSLLVKTEDEVEHPANRRAEIGPLN